MLIIGPTMGRRDLQLVKVPHHRPPRLILRPLRCVHIRPEVERRECHSARTHLIQPQHTRRRLVLLLHRRCPANPSILPAYMVPSHQARLPPQIRYHEPSPGCRNGHHIGLSRHTHQKDRLLHSMDDLIICPSSGWRRSDFDLHDSYHSPGLDRLPSTVRSRVWLGRATAFHRGPDDPGSKGCSDWCIVDDILSDSGRGGVPERWQQCL